MSIGKGMAKVITDLSIENNLEGFFYESLSELNKKSTYPLSEPFIIYTSEVMGRFGFSEAFFEVNDGKVKEKILGKKLLESSQLPIGQRKKTLREIGDLSMFICGYFAESLNNKLIDVSFYQSLGKSAYNQLDGYIPDYLEVPSFYENLSQIFDVITYLMNHISYMVQDNNSSFTDSLLIFENNKIKTS